jgi:phosphoserine phosphatase RsbU/P
MLVKDWPYKNQQQAPSKILVIDDESLVRQSIVVYLEDSGFDVIEAEDGVQGLAIYKQEQPDLVLCDLRMPEMDGLQVLQHLSEASPELPIIVISGAGQIHDVVEALRLGALDYLVKPISDMIVLENAVINALKRQQLEVENKVYKDELEQANLELELNLQRLQQDQEAGRRAQIQLLPEPNETINGFLFEHSITPSLNLSGDFIDYFKISDRYVGFYIADVSGHGAAAAFVTMTLKSLVNQPLRKYRSGENDLIIQPEELMKYLNTEFINANLNKHITFFYAVIDCQQMTMRYTTAGQYPAPIIRSNNQYKLLDQGGFPLGLFDWASYQSFELSIDKNFAMVMVSDGWLELFDTESERNKESLLINYVTDDEINMNYMLQPLKDYNSINVPDDITIFLISKKN